MISTSTATRAGFTVVVIVNLNGQDMPIPTSFFESIDAERFMTSQMRQEHCKRVSCAELAVTVPGDFFNEDGSRIGEPVVAPAEAPDCWTLLESAPEAQVARCRLAWKAVAAGEWADAAHFLRNAAREETGSVWSLGCSMRAELCAALAFA